MKSKTFFLSILPSVSLILAFFVPLVQISFVPKVKASPAETSVDLYVNGFDNNKPDWVEIGSSPYLDVQDEPINYVKGGEIAFDTSGDYSFEELPPETLSVVNVTLYFYQKADYTFQSWTIFLWDGSAWQEAWYGTPSSSYEWKSEDVTPILDSISKVDGTKMYFKSWGIVGGDYDFWIYVDAVYLKVWYEEVTGNVVELKTPNHEATETSWFVDFVFNPTFYQAIQNASLHLENTTSVLTPISWITNHWNTSAVDNEMDTTITYRFSENGNGTYKWNVQVFNSTHGIYAISNRTLTIDVSPHSQVVNSLDDAYQDGGEPYTWNTTGTTIRITCASPTPTYHGGLLFEGDIPKQAKIASANLSFYVPTSSWANPNLIIYGHDIDDAPTFGSGQNLVDRTKTSANYEWVKPPSWITPSSVHSKCGETAPNVATNTIDGDTDSYWRHGAACYHEIVFDMGETRDITKIRLYQSSTIGYRWGLDVGLYVYVSDDVENWGDSVWDGTLNAEGWQESGAFEKDGRYVKLISKADSTSQRMCEFDACATIGLGWYNRTVTNIVQEIVNRAGWSNGNNMSFLLMAKVSAGNEALYIASYDSDTTLAAKLYVDYEEWMYLQIGETSHEMKSNCIFYVNWSANQVSMDFYNFSWYDGNDWHNTTNNSFSGTWTNETRTLPIGTYTIKWVIDVTDLEGKSTSTGIQQFDITLSIGYYQINAGDHDACEQDTGAFYTDNTDGVKVYSEPSSNSYAGGFFFENVLIPQNCTITNAILYLHVYSGDYNDKDFKIYGEDANDSLDFTDAPYLVYQASKRSITDTHITITDNTTGWIKYPVWNIVEEVIRRSGWSTGNNITFILAPQNNEAKDARFDSYESSIAEAAILYIDYTIDDPESLIEYLQYYYPNKNCSNSIESVYFNYFFNLTTKKALEYEFSKLTSYGSILSWSVILKKLGIEDQTTIEYALDHATFAGDLPASGYETIHGTEQYYFMPNNAYLLHGFYWAHKYNHNTTAWNITAAYEWFEERTGTYLNSTHPATYYLADGTLEYYRVRLYDDAMAAVNCYTTFYDLLNVTEALGKASELYEKIYSEFWSTTQIPEGYFKYRWAEDIVEHQALGANLRACKLKALNDTVPLERWWLDAQHRALQSAWDSEAWMYYVVVHAKVHNTQRRLRSSIVMWTVLQQLYLKFNQTNQQKMIQMFNGSSLISPPVTPTPAWKLLLNTQANLWSEVDEQFRWDSDADISIEATFAGLLAMTVMGISPNTTTIAVPLEEESWTWIYFFDFDIFQLDFSTHVFRVPVMKSGKLFFKLNTTQCTAEFTSEAGVYDVKFADDWNSIESITYVSGLPEHEPFLFSVVYDVTTLSVGWNNFTACEVDVGYTLEEICATINSEGIEAIIIIKDNGIEYRYDYGYLANATVKIISTSNTLKIYCTSTGKWYHSYQNYDWYNIIDFEPGLFEVALTEWDATLDFAQTLTTSWSILVNFNILVGISQAISTTWTMLMQWNVIIDFSQILTTSWNVLANLNTFVDLSQALSTTWTTLTGWDTIVNLGQALSTSWNVLTKTDFVVSLSQAFPTLWTILTSWNTNIDLIQVLTTTWQVLPQWNSIIDLSQSLATSWMVLTKWDAIVDVTQVFSTSWTILTQTTFNVITNLSNTFTWLVDIIHTVGAKQYFVDLSQAISTSWTVLTQWNVITDLSQSLATSWSILTKWDATISLSQSLTITWMIITKTTFNVATSLSNSFSWLVAVTHYISVHHYIIDLSQVVSTSWNILTQSAFTINLSQPFSTIWTVLTQWNVNVDLSQSFSTIWTVLVQTSFNITTSLTNTFTWIINVFHWEYSGVTHYVDLTLTIITQWTSTIFYTLVPPINYAFVLAAFALIMFFVVFGIVMTKKDEEPL